MTDNDMNMLQMHTDSQPFLLDINADMQTDIMFMTADEEPKIKVAIADANLHSFEIKDFQEFVLSVEEDDSCL